MEKRLLKWNTLLLVQKKAFFLLNGINVCGLCFHCLKWWCTNSRWSFYHPNVTQWKNMNSSKKKIYLFSYGNTPSTDVTTEWIRTANWSVRVINTIYSYYQLMNYVTMTMKWKLMIIIHVIPLWNYYNFVLLDPVTQLLGPWCHRIYVCVIC